MKNMNVKTKKDIQQKLNTFADWAEFDTVGKKHYFVFKDTKRNGLWTIMQYQDGLVTRHGRGEDYSDNGEEVLSEKQCVDFLWENRKYVNESLKELEQLVKEK